MDKEELPLKRLMGELKKKTIQLEKAKKNLEESEERYRNLFENSPNIIFTLDLDGRINLVNKAVENLVGYNKEEIIGKRFKEFVPSKYLPSLLDAFEKEIRGIAVPTMEIEVMAKDGEKIPIELLHGSVPIKEKGKLVGIQITAMDLRERKETEKKLKESEQKYKDLFENASDTLFALDRLGRFTSGNKKAEEISGYKREELIGKHFKKVVPLKHMPKLLKLLQKAFKGEIEEAEFEVEMKNKKGKLIPLDVTARIIKENGKIIGSQYIARDISERKKTEESLRESEERYRKQFEEALDAIVIADAETGIIIDCNRVASELVGREKSELVGKHQRILHPPEEIEGEFSSTFKQHLKEKEGQVLEAQVITKKGEIREVAIKANLFELRGKKVLQGIFHDITERKRAEKALRASEKRFQDITENTGDWIWEVDTDGKYTYASPVVERILGYKPEEVIGNHFYDFFPLDEREQLKDAAFEVFDKKDPFVDFVNRNVRKDGRVVILETSGIPIIGHDGKLLGYRGADRDITERKKAEKAIKTSEEKYRTITENINVGIYRNTPGPKGKFIEANPAIVKMFVYDKEDFLKLNVSDLYQNPEDRKKFSEKIMKDGFVRNEEIQLKKKDGTPFWGSATAVAVRDEKGTIKYYDGMIDDITKRKEMEEELQKSYEETKMALEGEKKFIEKTSHNFFNPLCIAKGYIALQLERDIPEETRKEVESVKRAIERIKKS